MSTLTCVLQLGTSRIRAVAAWRDDLGQYQVAAIEGETSLGSVRHGCVVSVDDAAARIKQLMQKLNNRLLGASLTLPSGSVPHDRQDASLAIDRLYVGLDGISLRTVPHEPSVQLPEGTTVTPEVLERLRDISLSTRLQGYDILGVEPSGYLLDGVPTLNPAGRTGRQLTATHQLVVAQTRLKAGAAAAVAKAGFKVAGFIVQPLAAAAIVSPDERQRGCVLIDVGASLTTVAVYAKGVLRNLVTIPLGGDVVTRDIMTKNLRHEEAEQYKTQWGNAMPDAGDDADRRPLEAAPVAPAMRRLPLGELNSIIACRYEEILANVARQVEAAGCEPYRLGAGCVLTGGGAMQKGLPALISRRLGVTRVVVRSFSVISSAPYEQRPCDTALMAMLPLCVDDCREVRTPSRPPSAVPAATPPAAAPAQASADAAGEVPVAAEPPASQPAPVPSAVTPRKPRRKRGRVVAFLGDLFSGQQDDEEDQ